MLSKISVVPRLLPRAYFHPTSAKNLFSLPVLSQLHAPNHINIHRIPARYFAEDKQSSSKQSLKVQKQNETSTGKTEKPAGNYKRGMINEGEEELKADFINFMQKDDSQTGADLTYTDKNVFHVHSRKDDFTKKYIFYWGMSSVWFAVSFLTFNYINPYVAIIPVWFLAGSMMTIRMAAKFAKTMVRKIELLDNEHINIYPLSMKGKGVKCNIKDTEVLGIKVLSASPPTKDGKESSITSYLIMANFVESAKGKAYSRMRLIVDPNLTSVANIDLLKAILYGKTDEVARYEYLEKTEEEKKEEEEKAEKGKVIESGGEAQFDFKEEEFEELRKEFKSQKQVLDEQKKEEDKQSEK